MPNELPQRYREVLDILISDYIASAMPVASRSIAKRHTSKLSPATIRSALVDLTELGLLHQPHTSAGRVPTTRGMRYYVDSLLKTHELSDEEQSLIRARCDDGGGGVHTFLQRASCVLSAISHYVGLVALPREEEIVFKHIAFLQLARGRLLGIFVAQSGFVQNLLIDVDEDFSYADLERINNFCLRAFVGLNLVEARAKVASELEREREDVDRWLQNALQFSHRLLGAVPACDLMIEGESQLFSLPEFAELERFRALMAALAEKQRIVKLLDRCREAAGVKIFIGAEAEDVAPGTTSIVSAPYRKAGRVVGMLGVIGPQRMDYAHVVPIVDFTAKLVGDFLEHEG